jgi:outer membrane lipoprotein carrier protein
MESYDRRRSRAVLSAALSGALVASTALWLMPGAAAQGQVDARTVAGAVQSFYNQTRGVRASFHQTYYHKLYDRYDRSRGSVVFAKPGKMRWDYGRPNGKVITSDGGRLIVYEPGDQGERGQCFEREMNQHQLPGAFSFLTGTGRLEEDFRFRLLDPRRQGYPEGYVLELRPRAASPHYDRILFYVLTQNARPTGVVRRVLIIDPAGNRNRFDFSEMQWNPSVSDATFRFRPPAGIRCTRP